MSFLSFLAHLFSSAFFLLSFQLQLFKGSDTGEVEGEAWQENESTVQSVNSVLFRYWGMPTADKLKSKVAGTQGRLCTIWPMAQANQVCGRARRAYYRPKNEQTTTWAERDIFIMTSRMAANWTEKCTGAPILKKVGKLTVIFRWSRPCRVDRRGL